METLEVVLVNVGLVILLAFIVEVLVEHFVGKPLEVAAPDLPPWWLSYVALLAGVALGWFAGVNMFGDVLPDLVGRIVTAILIGGGSPLIHSVVNKARNPLAGVLEV
jgi:hypothetical protein